MHFLEWKLLYTDSYFTALIDWLIDDWLTGSNVVLTQEGHQADKLLEKRHSLHNEPKITKLNPYHAKSVFGLRPCQILTAPSRAVPMVVLPLCWWCHHKKPHSPSHALTDTLCTYLCISRVVGSALFQVLACCLFSAKPLPDLTLT